MDKELLDGPVAMIGPADRKLFHVTDSLEEAVSIIEKSTASRTAATNMPVLTDPQSPTAEGTLSGLPARVYRRKAAPKAGRPKAEGPVAQLAIRLARLMAGNIFAQKVRFALADCS
jgi:hypothetical protein